MQNNCYQLLTTKQPVLHIIDFTSIIFCYQQRCYYSIEHDQYSYRTTHRGCFSLGRLPACLDLCISIDNLQSVFYGRVCSIVSLSLSVRVYLYLGWKSTENNALPYSRKYWRFGPQAGEIKILADLKLAVAGPARTPHAH